MTLRKILYKLVDCDEASMRWSLFPLGFLLRQPKYAERLEKWNMVIDCSAEDDFPLESFISEDPATKHSSRKD